MAIDLAARCDFRDRVAALIIENTFTSIPAVAKELFQFAILRWIPHFFFKNRVYILMNYLIIKIELNLIVVLILMNI